MRRLLTVIVMLATLVVAASGCTGSTEVQTDLNAIATAQDTAATTLLLTAMVAATTYAGTSGAGYAAFNAASAAQDEPGIKWTDGAAAQGVVAIRGATSDDLVLVTKSASGDALCLAQSAAGQTKGKVDAANAADCTGGW